LSIRGEGLVLKKEPPISHEIGTFLLISLVN